MKTVVFVAPHAPFVEVCNCVFLKDILSLGIDVEFWNVSPFTWGREYALRHGAAVFPQKIIDTAVEFDQMLASKKPCDTLINIQSGVSPVLQPIYSSVRRHKFITSVFLSGLFSEAFDPMDKKVWKQFLKIIKKSIPEDIYSKASLAWNALLKREKKRPTSFVPDIVFAQGQRGATLYPESTNIPCNWFDYEQWLIERASPAYPGSEGACVFLDEGLCHHPDFKLAYGKDDLSAPLQLEYYHSMCKLFDKIEAELLLPVIIAAHPKSQYRGGEFGDRKIVQGHTLACMRGARMAVAHMSTTCAQSAMYKVPLLLVTCGVIKQEFKKEVLPHIKNWGRLLGAPIIDADNLPPSLLPYCGVNQDLYSKFLHEYYTWPQYETELSGPQIADFIKTL